VVSARTLYRHKYFAVVNAVGLALGMSVSLFLITMLAFINTYDNFSCSQNPASTGLPRGTKVVVVIYDGHGPGCLGRKAANRFYRHRWNNANRYPFFLVM